MIAIVLVTCIAALLFFRPQDIQYKANQLDISETRAVANLTKIGVFKSGQRYTSSTMQLESVEMNVGLKQSLLGLRWLKCTHQSNMYRVEYANSVGKEFVEMFEGSLIDGIVDN